MIRSYWRAVVGEIVAGFCSHHRSSSSPTVLWVAASRSGVDFRHQARQLPRRVRLGAAEGHTALPAAAARRVRGERDAQLPPSPLAAPQASPHPWHPWDGRWGIRGMVPRPTSGTREVSALTCYFAVRPLGFEPRTCGLRVEHLD